MTVSVNPSLPSTAGPSLPRLVRANLRRSFVGRAWSGLVLAGVGMSSLTSYGYLQIGVTDNVWWDVTGGHMVRSWFMMLLFAALLPAVLFGREVSSGTFAREAVLVPDRRRLFWSKTTMALGIGAALGTIAAGLSIVTTQLFLGTQDQPLQFVDDVTLTIVGVFFCSLIAAPMGMFVAMITRSTVAATGVLLFAILLVEPGLQRLVPSFAQYLFSIALSGLYRDPKPILLGQVSGALVATAWVVAVGAVAYRRIMTRDID